jgi:putative flippase GtrA
MTAITRRLPFGLSDVIEPNMLGYLLINLCTFFIDLSLLAVFHGTLRWPLPVAVTCSYGTASVVSYVLNRVLNFRSHADVGRQFPVYVAVSASNYLIFVLGLTDLLSAAGVYYELSRILAACCEGVYLYCMMRWVVFRDVTQPAAPELAALELGSPEPAAPEPATPEPATVPAAQAPPPTATLTVSAEATQEPALPKTLPR